MLEMIDTLQEVDQALIIFGFVGRPRVRAGDLIEYFEEADLLAVFRCLPVMLVDGLDLLLQDRQG